ncbi:MAG: hypothetical protein RLZZ393_1580, partial [Pseudomonadota bacterium]
DKSCQGCAMTGIKNGRAAPPEVDSAALSPGPGLGE